MDRHTQGPSTYHISIASHGKNVSHFSQCRDYLMKSKNFVSSTIYYRYATDGVTWS